MAERPGRAGSGTARRCVSCGAEGRTWSAGRCPACALGAELRRLRAEGDPSAVARLEPLLVRLAAHDKPRSALSWLTRSPAAPTFRALLGGEVAISHAALDERDVGQATAYLRSWLVGHGVLEPRDERLARFERWAHTTLVGVADYADRAHLTAYARWKLQPDLARRLRTGRVHPTSHRWLYAKLRTAIKLTAWLHDQGRALDQLRQPLVDEWIAGAPSRALATRDFLDWAHHAGLVPVLHVSRRRRRRAPPRSIKRPASARRARYWRATRSSSRRASPAVSSCSTGSARRGSRRCAPTTSIYTVGKSASGSARHRSSCPSRSPAWCGLCTSVRRDRGCCRAPSRALTSGPSASAAGCAN